MEFQCHCNRPHFPKPSRSHSGPLSAWCWLVAVFPCKAKTAAYGLGIQYKCGPLTHDVEAVGREARWGPVVFAPVIEGVYHWSPKLLTPRSSTAVHFVSWFCLTSLKPSWTSLITHPGDVDPHHRTRTSIQNPRPIGTFQQHRRPQRKLALANSPWLGVLGEACYWSASQLSCRVHPSKKKQQHCFMSFFL